MCPYHGADKETAARRRAGHGRARRRRREEGRRRRGHACRSPARLRFRPGRAARRVRRRRRRRGSGRLHRISLAVDFAGRLSGRFPWLLFALPVLGIASILLYRLLRLPVDLATDTVVGNMRKNRRVPAALTPGILLGTCLTVAGGGSVGKEAAVMQMGASLGSTVGRPFRLRAIRRQRQGEGELEGYAAACGMAAAFSALFFAPIGSTVFVLGAHAVQGPGRPPCGDDASGLVRRVRHREAHRHRRRHPEGGAAGALVGHGGGVPGGGLGLRRRRRAVRGGPQRAAAPHAPARRAAGAGRAGGRAADRGPGAGAVLATLRGDGHAASARSACRERRARGTSP